MRTIKIDFSEDVSIDTLLLPVYDNLQKCVGGLLFKEKKPDKSIYVTTSYMLYLVKNYKLLLPFCREQREAVRIVDIAVYKIVLGDLIVAYRLNGGEYEDTIVSREEYLEIFGD